MRHLTLEMKYWWKSAKVNHVYRKFQTFVNATNGLYFVRHVHYAASINLDLNENSTTEIIGGLRWQGLINSFHRVHFEISIHQKVNDIGEKLKVKYVFLELPKFLRKTRTNFPLKFLASLRQATKQLLPPKNVAKERPWIMAYNTQFICSNLKRVMEMVCRQ